MKDFFGYDEAAAGPDAERAGAAVRGGVPNPPLRDGAHNPPLEVQGSAVVALPPILAELSDAEWEAFIGFAVRRRYPAGACIVGRGDTSPALCFVAEGRVRIERTPGDPQALLRGEGEVFGLLCFLDGAPSDISATAIDGVELVMLEREALPRLAAWQPRIALALLRDLGAHTAARLRRVQPGD